MNNQSEQTLRLSKYRRHHVQDGHNVFTTSTLIYLMVPLKQRLWMAHFILLWSIYIPSQGYFCFTAEKQHAWFVHIFMVLSRVRLLIETLHHQQFLTFIASGLLCTGPPRSSKNATPIGCYMLAIWALTQLSFCSGYWAWPLRSFFKSWNFKMATIS